MTGVKSTLKKVLCRYTLPPESHEILNKFYREGVVTINGHTVLGLNPLTRLLRMRMMVAGWCVDEDDAPVILPQALQVRLRALHKVLAQTTGKVIVCCAHLHELGTVAQSLEEAGVEYLTISGSTKQKNLVIDEFQVGPAKVLLVQPQSVSMAVDISVAEDLIWYSSDFNYVTFRQASDRIKLSPSSPTVYFLCAKGTVDEDVWVTLTKDHDHLKDTIKRVKNIS